MAGNTSQVELAHRVMDQLKPDGFRIIQAKSKGGQHKDSYWHIALEIGSHSRVTVLDIESKGGQLFARVVKGSRAFWPPAKSPNLLRLDPSYQRGISLLERQLTIVSAVSSGAPG